MQKCKKCGQAITNAITPVKPITPKNILDIISNREKIPLELLKSKTRLKEISDVRQMYMYVTKEYNQKFTLTEIGLLVNRDHATVIHSIANVARKMLSNPVLRARITSLQLLLHEVSQPIPSIDPVVQTSGTLNQEHQLVGLSTTEVLGDRNRIQLPGPEECL